MTHEERIAFRSEIEHKAKSLMERLKKACAEPMGWSEMMDASDILKDLSEVEKNLAKVHHLESEHPVHDEKKY
jgi:hypothetical protein